MIPKVVAIDPFHRGDFGRQQGARCAVVRVQQAARNAAGGQKRPALRVGRIGAARVTNWVALRRLPDPSSAAAALPLRRVDVPASRRAVFRVDCDPAKLPWRQQN